MACACALHSLKSKCDTSVAPTFALFYFVFYVTTQCFYLCRFYILQLQHLLCWFCCFGRLRRLPLLDSLAYSRRCCRRNARKNWIKNTNKKVKEITWQVARVNMILSQFNAPIACLCTYSQLYTLKYYYWFFFFFCLSFIILIRGPQALESWLNAMFVVLFFAILHVNDCKVCAWDPANNQQFGRLTGIC